MACAPGGMIVTQLPCCVLAKTLCARVWCGVRVVRSTHDMTCARRDCEQHRSGWYWAQPVGAHSVLELDVVGLHTDLDEVRRAVLDMEAGMGSLGFFFFFFQAEDGIRDYKVTGVQTCALPISRGFCCDDLSDYWSLAVKSTSNSISGAVSASSRATMLASCSTYPSSLRSSTVRPDRKSVV